MNSDKRVYLSDRNIPLAYSGSATLVGVISVEASSDWHSLYLVKNNAIYRIDADDQTLPRRNGALDPTSLVQYANDHGYDVDVWSMQMIVGRFTLATNGDVPPRKSD